MSIKVGIITLGCKVNQYESEAFAEELERRGYHVSDGSDRCDAYIVNTCTVTAEADRKSRQMIRRAARASSSAPIVVTGCTAEYSAEELAKIDGVIAVCGNGEKMKCIDILDDYFHSSESHYPIIHTPSIWDADFEKMCLKAFPRTRVYIKIEDGCENKCAYCAIPRARGNVRSKLPEDILREVKGFIDEGCPEIVLTGIETASYGKDLNGVKLGFLLRLVDAIAGKCRIRLGSLDPSLFKESFVNEIKSLTSLAPHFHISLQSGSSGVLALMRRKYNADMARDAIARIREAIPNVMLTTDVIVGFPGETEDDFIETAQFLHDARFLSAHIFPYSEREGTVAASMPNSVPVHIRKERAAALIELQRHITNDLLTEEISREPEREVLFETYADGKAFGHTDSFIEVCVNAPCDLRGNKLTVRLIDHDGTVCHGVITNPAALSALIPGKDYIPKRKAGIVKGFNNADKDFLSRVARDLKLPYSNKYLSLVQEAFQRKGTDPTVAEVYFYSELYKYLIDVRKFFKHISSVATADKDVCELLTDLSRRYYAFSGSDKTDPVATSLAEFAASGSTAITDSGFHICRKSNRELPSLYSGLHESIEIGNYIFTLSTGKPLRTQKAGEICVLLSLPQNMSPEEYITSVSVVCKRFSEIDAEASFIPMEDEGFLQNLNKYVNGALIDVTLLPTPSAYAEDVLHPQNLSVMIFTRKKLLPELWKIADEFSLKPCAPAIVSQKGYTIKAPEGNVIIPDLNALIENTSLNLKYEFNHECELESGLLESQATVRDFSIAPFTITAIELGKGPLYEELEKAMSDKEAVYAISGTISVLSDMTVPAILILDAFMRNNHPRVLYSRFFYGDSTTICIFKLTKKK